MERFLLLKFLLFFLILNTSAQNRIKGIIKDSNSNEPLSGVLVSIKGKPIQQITSENGTFLLQNVPKNNVLIVLRKKGYETQNLPIRFINNTIDLGVVFLYKDEFTEEQDVSTIILTDDELNDESSIADNISGLLQSSKDAFLKAVAYDWSTAFYRLRGLDSDNSKVLFNGIEMNKLYNGRPQWNNWGGLNDVLRNQEFSYGLTPSNYAFGGVLGATNFNIKASEYRKGGKVSYASSNNSYTHRIMASYATGLLKNNWAFTFAGSSRNGTEGYIQGTTYDAYSAFLSVSKKINKKHSLNFAAILATNKKGKSAAHTKEVYELKGRKYNEYWGYQENRKRNSRIRRIFEPILILNYYLNINRSTKLTTSVLYQFGEVGNSRLDYNGGTNPSPIYYQKLPSYWLSRNDFRQAYEATERFKNNGQINWKNLYKANITNAEQGKSAAYLLYEDRNDDKQLTINTVLNTEINDNISFTGKLKYTQLQSDNFAYVLGLLGGTAYLDINRFAKLETPQRQNNLLNPNRIVKKQDKFKYHYNLHSEVMGAFAQSQFNYHKTDFYLATNISKTTHQREGFYKNGRFEDNSLGKSKKQEFLNFGVKAGTTYKITGRHLLNLNAGYVTKAPTLRNTFSNARENNAIVRNLTSEKLLTTDVSYIFRSPKIQSKITGFYTDVQDATNIGFFYQQGLFGEAFVQEIVTGIHKKHFGMELGIEAMLTSRFKVKGALNYGQYFYANNPNVYVTSEDFTSSENAFGINDLGKSYLKNYKVATPQKVYSLGFEYRSSDYWWISTTANYFDDAYLNISPIARSEAFYKSFDNLPINNINNSVAKKLLKQEKFENYVLINIFGGKSWRIGKNYNLIGFTLGVSNMLNTVYKTGGYEQSRKPDYTQLLEEHNRPKKLFGAKYWYGRGTSYFLNMYYRF